MPATSPHRRYRRDSLAHFLLYWLRFALGAWLEVSWPCWNCLPLSGLIVPRGACLPELLPCCHSPCRLPCAALSQPAQFAKPHCAITSHLPLPPRAGAAALRALPALGPAGHQLCGRGSVLYGGSRRLARQPQGRAVGAAHPLLPVLAGAHVWQVSAQRNGGQQQGTAACWASLAPAAAALGEWRHVFGRMLPAATCLHCTGPHVAVTHTRAPASNSQRTKCTVLPSAATCRSWSQHIFIDPRNPRDSYCLTYNCAGGCGGTKQQGMRADAAFGGGQWTVVPQHSRCCRLGWG